VEHSFVVGRRFDSDGGSMRDGEQSETLFYLEREGERESQSGSPE